MTYSFYKLYKEWILDIQTGKKERRFVAGELDQSTIKSLEKGEIDLDNQAEKSIIKVNQDTFTFYKEFKRKKV